MVPIKSLYFVSNQAKSTVVCMASFLISSGRTSLHFDNIHIKVLTRAYFEVCFHSILSKYENSKHRFLLQQEIAATFFDVLKSFFRPTLIRA